VDAWEPERDAIKAAAEAAGMSVSDWVRRVALKAAGYRGPAAIVT
jgi:uncharacterized protein (DUF1778 family)